MFFLFHLRLYSSYCLEKSKKITNKKMFPDINEINSVILQYKIFNINVNEMEMFLFLITICYYIGKQFL